MRKKKNRDVRGARLCIIAACRSAIQCETLEEKSSRVPVKSVHGKLSSALVLKECGEASQVYRCRLPPCVKKTPKTCEMEEEPVRPAILCSDRPLL